MIKTRRIVKGTGATMLAVFGLIMIVWGHGRPAPQPARGGADTVRAVRLRLTFEGGHWANVTAAEGSTIKVESDGKKLAITPYVRDQNGGKVELRVSQAVRQAGGETMEAAGTLSVDKGLTKLDQGGLSFGVQVLDADKRLPSELLAAPAAECCTRTCSGVLVCGVCVCTDCGVCFTHGWCDCNPPAPPRK